jgi:ankyrin repeat protein
MRPLNEPEDRTPSTRRQPPPLPSPERVQKLLFEAARLGRDDMIPVLLEAGADIEGVDAKGHTALVLATYHGFKETADLLLDRGADPDGTTASGSPLMGVAFKGHLAIARRLLAAGADPNLRNAAGQTAIMMSALFDRREVIEVLLGAGADIDAVDAAGNDAASLARMQGNESLARWLKERREGHTSA